MSRRSSSRLVAAVVASALWPGLGNILVGQPFLGLTLMVATVASLLATMLFYGYVTTPLVWLTGLVAASVGARRRAAGRRRWPIRRLRTLVGCASLAAAGLVAFHVTWSIPKAPGTVRSPKASAPAGPSPEAVVWSGPEGLHSLEPRAYPALSVTELGHLRWWTAIATQPAGQWEGFYSLEQFGQTALRYQLAFASYTLAQAQSVKLPAYRSPLVGALRSLVVKMLHPDVWGYWRWEALAGFGRRVDDPVAEANVMYSGHLASMAGLARLVTGRPLYQRADSLLFARGPKVVASYSLRALMERLAHQFRAEPSHVIACEPHQAFVMCNNHAGLALVLGARLREEPALAEAVSHYRRAYGRRFLGDGPDPTLRYPYYPPLDRTLPFHLVLGDGWSIATLSGLMPEEARRLYSGYRRRIFGREGASPRSVPAAPLYESLDVGSMRASAASQAAFALLAARELGDGPGSRELLSTIEGRYGPRWIGGRRTYRDLSPLLHAVVLLARLTPPGGIGALFTKARPAEAWSAPHLAAVEGGAMDVVQAVYVPREEALLVGLVAGSRGGRRTLVVAGLEPARRYTLVTNGRVAAAGLKPRDDGTLRVAVAGALPVRCVIAAHRRLEGSPGGS